MLASGLHLAYGVFNSFGYWAWFYKSATALVCMAGSFHLTTIIGAFATSLIYNKIDILKIHVSHKSYDTRRFNQKSYLSVYELLSDVDSFNFDDSFAGYLLLRVSCKIDAWTRFRINLHRSNHLWIRIIFTELSKTFYLSASSVSDDWFIHL